MSDEARITAGLNVVKRSGSSLLINYNSVDSFSVTVTGTKGPCVGTIAIAVTGTDVDLSEITTPGLAKFRNLDASNYVEYGIREPDTNDFYPLGEIGPGECYVLKLSRNLTEQYEGTGTGTTSASNYLHFRANAAACNVTIEVFER